MKRSKHPPFLRLVVAGLLLCCTPTACTGDRAGLVLFSYNVQNLFDAHDDGGEYAEYTQAGGWTEDLYFARLRRLAEVITNSCDQLPGLMVFQEIEGEVVLRDLLRDHLRRARLRPLAVPVSGSSTTVGVLTAVPVVAVRTHRTVYAQLGATGELLRSADRPTLELELLVDGRPVTCFCVHWKSQSGGEQETEPYRLLQAALLRHLIAQRRAAHPNRPCVAVGDFNEDLYEYHAHGGAYQTAIMPAEDAAGVPAPGRSVLFAPAFSGVPESGASLYSPWPGARAPGTYYFRGAWERLDQIFVTADLADGTGLDLIGFGPVTSGPHVDPEGYPLRWEPHRERGYSDHLPIVAEFGEAGAGAP